MSDTLTNLVYHVVFSTKNREPLIRPNIRTDLYSYIGGIIRGENGTPLEIGGMPDHVHILAKFHSDVSVAKMMRHIKTNSSKWINQRKVVGPFRWQAGYGAFTVSQSQVSAVPTYVRNQAVHHKRVSFQQEFLALLRRHGIAFDEQHLWR